MFSVQTNELKVTTETITPEVAYKWLSKGPPKSIQQRSLKNYKIRRMADDMRGGHWSLNGEAIKLSTSGKVIDGQNRLHAIIKANTPIKTLVVRGVPSKDFVTLDSGSPRTASDALKIAGYKSVAMLSGMTRSIINYEIGGCVLSAVAQVRPTSRMILERVDNDPGVVDALKFFDGKYRRLNGLFSPTIGSALYYFWHKRDADCAKDFFHSLLTGENLYKGHPVFALRDRLIKSKTLRAHELKTVDKAAFMIIAWNKYRNNEEINSLMWRRFGPNAMPFPNWE